MEPLETALAALRQIVILAEEGLPSHVLSATAATAIMKIEKSSDQSGTGIPSRIVGGKES